MRYRSGLTGWKMLALVTLLIATLFAMGATALAHHLPPDTPVAVCEFVDGEDLEAARPQVAAPLHTPPAAAPVESPVAVLTPLHLITVIFRPPEGA